MLIGQPNVGKSTLLNALTGAHALVSNFPGTTVEVFSARLKTANGELELVDTPGTYSLMPGTAEKAVTLAMLEREPDAVLLNVIDGCNMLRQLTLTNELLKLGRPVLVAVTQVDRMRHLGISADFAGLSQALGVPVVPVSAVTGEGIACVKKLLVDALTNGDFRGGRQVPASVMRNLIRTKKLPRMAARSEAIEELFDAHPLGLLLLLLILSVLCLGIVWFQGITEWLFSGVLVKAEQFLVYTMEALPISAAWKDIAIRVIPGGLFVPFGIVMPSMLAVYLAIAFLEDSGLLPRIVAAADGPCSVVGFQGDCLIPVVLAFGCRTPAILASRVIGNPSQRKACQCLISVAVPCAATLGIVGAVIQRFSADARIIFLTMILGGYAAATLASGSFPLKPGQLLIELPPIRAPLLSNVYSKTWSRMSHFFMQALPLILITNVIVRAAIAQGLLDGLHTLTPFTNRWFGIRGEAAAGLAVTVAQRYLAPLVLLNLELTHREATICAAMLMLSFPCVPVTACLAHEAGASRVAKVFFLSAVEMTLTGLTLNAVLR